MILTLLVYNPISTYGRAPTGRVRPERRRCFLRLHGGQSRPRPRQYSPNHSDFGAAYGTAKAGTGISSISIWRPGVVMKSLIPVVMAGILGIYGMIVAVIISQRGKPWATQ